MKYARTVAKLRSKAAYWWPISLATLEADASIIPILLKSQNQFVSLLKLSGKTPFMIFDILNKTDLAGNLFLKHLVVLSDFGGEPLQRLNSNFTSLFELDKKSKRHFLEFVWKEQGYKYDFKALPLRRALNNSALNIDGPSLLVDLSLNDLHTDVAMILLFGATSKKETTAETLSKCEIGSLLGLSDDIDKYVDQRYIWVSRITGGAQANSLGQKAQTYVVEYLRSKLGKKFKISRNGKINVVGHKMPFDVVVEKNGRFIGIEVSFQVTTNSTIERKANEAENRYNLMSAAKYPIAYVIDGAGNFHRASAISKICSNSDCTVAYTDAELNVLAKFITENLK